MKIDAFIFNDELDLLEIRLHILAHAVDKFILVESPFTFQGNSKPLHYAENKERFSRFSIVHIVDECAPDKNPWKNEDRQRDCIMRALTDERHDALVVTADVDDIWNPELPLLKDTIRIIEVRPFFLNAVIYRFDPFPVICTVDTLKKYPPSHMRKHGRTMFPSVSDGGWSFPWVGKTTEAEIKLKLASFSHAELNNDGGVLAFLKEAAEFKIEPHPIAAWPAYLRENWSKYTHLMKHYGLRD